MTTRRILLMGAWLGLAYGLAEALVVMLLALVPGGLSWRTGNSANVLWFAPVFYAGAFLVIAMLTGLGARVRPRLPWDVGLVWATVWLGGWLGMTIPGKPFTSWSAALLALGIAVETSRQYRRHREVLGRFMSRSLPYLIATVLLLAAAVLGGGRLAEARAMAALPQPRPESPNVLLLILDTQRADHLSAYGYSRPTSPNLARFAQEGTLFLNAYSSSSWTLPSHASLMTGRPLHEHLAGVLDRPYLDRRYLTLAEALREEGYATGGFIANHFWVGRQTRLDRGFIRFEDFWGSPGDAVTRTALGRRLMYQVLPVFGLVDIPGRKRADDLNRDLLQWVDGLEGKRPFFAFANYFDIHEPYLPPAPYEGRFADGRVRDPRRRIEVGAIGLNIKLPPAEKLNSLRDAYDESILYLDAELGNLFRELRARGVLDNTITIITSDHGESWGEHGMLFHGHSLYREQLHVPLIVRYPGRIARNRRAERPVGLEQVPATVAGLVGLRPGAFPGHSLFAADSSAPAVLAELARRSPVAGNWPGSRGWLASVLTDRWQLIRPQREGPELYDLVGDPRQDRNLHSHPETGGELAKLDGALAGLVPLNDPDLMTGRAQRSRSPAPVP